MCHHSVLQLMDCPVLQLGVIQAFLHRTMEYPELEETNKDHQSPTPNSFCDLPQFSRFRLQQIKFFIH